MVGAKDAPNVRRSFLVRGDRRTAMSVSQVPSAGRRRRPQIPHNLSFVLAGKSWHHPGSLQFITEFVRSFNKELFGLPTIVENYDSILLGRSCSSNLDKTHVVLPEPGKNMLLNVNTCVFPFVTGHSN